MLHWEWRHGRPQLSRRQENDAEVTLATESTGRLTKSVIQYNPPTKSTRILGVHINPMGDFTDHLTALREKSDKMANQLRFSRITPDNMMTFLRTMYTPAMLYALPAVATDEENLAGVQTNMITTALQKLGASKTTPTEIRHGPLELGGLNILDLRTEIGISNLKFLRTAIYSGSEEGKTAAHEHKILPNRGWRVIQLIGTTQRPDLILDGYMGNISPTIPLPA